MSPRVYRAGERRQQATEATRARIIDAARGLLGDPQTSSFSIDAVAERADVARMTVYYQFKSKAKLLEALLDDFAARANMRDLRIAFTDPDPVHGLGELVTVFCRLWETERAILRRLNALAVLDREVGRALTQRGGWRREALNELVSRIPDVRQPEDVVDLLHVLTSFETYDALAAQHKPKEIAPLLTRAAQALLRS